MYVELKDTNIKSLINYSKRVSAHYQLTSPDTVYKSVEKCKHLNRYLMLTLTFTEDFKAKVKEFPFFVYQFKLKPFSFYLKDYISKSLSSFLK